MDKRMLFFHTLTCRVFSNWTALRLAVENDMGTVEEAYQFCQWVACTLTEKKDLCSNEIEYVLEDYMQDVFNTELEDFSSQQVADELYRFYFEYGNGNVIKAMSELEKLPPVQQWINPSLMKIIKKPTVEISSDSSENDEKEESMETEVSEWTVVKSGRKK